MKPFVKHTGKVAVLNRSNVDTDQIIPKQFLTKIEKTGFGKHLFYDWRYQSDGTENPDFELNLPQYRDASILIAGDNFGCGSSREHAPWALTGFGFKAILATSFADIFYNNALKNGLLPVVIDEDTHRKLLDARTQDVSLEITIDLDNQSVSLPDGTQVSFPVDSFARTCLMKGTDQLGYLLSFDAEITRFEQEQENALTQAAGV